MYTSGGTHTRRRCMPNSQQPTAMNVILSSCCNCSSVTPCVRVRACVCACVCVCHRRVHRRAGRAPGSTHHTPLLITVLAPVGCFAVLRNASICVSATASSATAPRDMAMPSTKVDIPSDAFARMAGKRERHPVPRQEEMREHARCNVADILWDSLERHSTSSCNAEVMLCAAKQKDAKPIWSRLGDAASVC